MDNSFYFYHKSNKEPVFKATMYDNETYVITWDGCEGGTYYLASDVQEFVQKGDWIPIQQ